jgi:hypothetical protein
MLLEIQSCSCSCFQWFTHWSSSFALIEELSRVGLLLWCFAAGLLSAKLTSQSPYDLLTWWDEIEINIADCPIQWLNEIPLHPLNCIISHRDLWSKSYKPIGPKKR